MISNGIVSVVCLSLSVVFTTTSGQGLDPIALLSSCGSECWTKDPTNKSPENINPGPQAFDGAVTRCMQICFAAKTKTPDRAEKLPPPQVMKIKVASYCGYVCYNNNKASKKSLDFCYAGCLGTILQSKGTQKLQANASPISQPLPPAPTGQVQGQAGPAAAGGAPSQAIQTNPGQVAVVSG